MELLTIFLLALLAFYVVVAALLITACYTWDERRWALAWPFFMVLLLWVFFWGLDAKSFFKRKEVSEEHVKELRARGVNLS